MSQTKPEIIAEFQGTVSPENRQYQLRRLKKRTVITMSCAMAFVYVVLESFEKLFEGKIIPGKQDNDA